MRAKKGAKVMIYKLTTTITMKNFNERRPKDSQQELKTSKNRKDDIILQAIGKSQVYLDISSTKKPKQLIEVSGAGSHSLVYRS